MLGVVLAGNAVMVGIEAVGIAIRMVPFEEMLRLGLGGEVRAVPIAKSGSGLGRYGEDEKGGGKGWGGETQTTRYMWHAFLLKS